MIHDHTRCELGEGPLWHPLRKELFWFDITGHKLHASGRVWQWGEPVSAAGWVDRNRLVVASASALWVFRLDTDERIRLAELEADNPDTRSNDGKADPWGGFWIGTMGRRGGADLGTIYRWYRGELRPLHVPISTPNAMCFDRDRSMAYFSDTPHGQVFRQPLDAATGWPAGPAEVFLDLRGEGLHPDGATVDAAGRFWCAQWGAGRVTCHAPDGTFLTEQRFPASRATCAAFGGADMDILFVTSASEGVADAEPDAGKVFRHRPTLNGRPVVGLPEPCVILNE